MAFQNIQDADMNLVLSSEAKPRLKWTPELHQRFIRAVNQLGGADKATPKSLMRVMDINGLTLFHLKSHLQKFRLGKSHQPQANNLNDDQEECEEKQRSIISSETHDGSTNQINPSSQIAQALQMQMEVQRKLHQQIEVQRHLQLRIEAQGKYLQSVLKRAQETLARYNSSPSEVELAKAELSQLVSMVEARCSSSSLSVLTESEVSLSKDTENKQQLTGPGCSLESSLVSSERSGCFSGDHPEEEIDETEKSKRVSALLPLMEMNPGHVNRSESEVSERKRSSNIIVDENCVEKPSGKRFQGHEANKQLRKLDILERFDLNSIYVNDFDIVSKVLDLNSEGVELFG